MTPDSDLTHLFAPLLFQGQVLRTLTAARSSSREARIRVPTFSSRLF